MDDPLEALTDEELIAHPKVASVLEAQAKQQAEAAARDRQVQAEQSQAVAHHEKVVNYLGYLEGLESEDRQKILDQEPNAAAIWGQRQTLRNPPDQTGAQMLIRSVAAELRATEAALAKLPDAVKRRLTSNTYFASRQRTPETFGEWKAEVGRAVARHEIESEKPPASVPRVPGGGAGSTVQALNPLAYRDRLSRDEAPPTAEEIDAMTRKYLEK